MTLGIIARACYITLFYGTPMSNNRIDSNSSRHTERVEISPTATVVNGEIPSGKSCRLIDNTGTIAAIKLEGILRDLIANDVFGIKGFSSDGSSLRLDQPQFAHVQIDEELYRLLIYRYEAYIEKY
jgi:hypothetical protein